MELFKIYIPTYKRAYKIITHKLLPEAIVVCPESQVEEYLAVNPELNIMPCPDAIDGNIARKRNWIKKQCDTPYFIMVDDDITDFQRMECRRKFKMNHDEIINMFIQGFQLMEDLGTVLWGINSSDATMFYMDYTPFSLQSPILGPFTAQKNVQGLWYDERLFLKEDYGLFLQVLQKYHKTLRMNKYSYITKHLTNAEGGCVDYRTMAREYEQNILLQKKWGSKVVKFNMDKGVNPTIKSPYKGV